MVSRTLAESCAIPPDDVVATPSEERDAATRIYAEAVDPLVRWPGALPDLS